MKPRRRRQNVCLYHKLLPNKLRQGDLNVAVFELKHDNPGLRQRSRGYVHPEEGVGGGWEGSMTTSVDAWERGPSELDHFWIGGFTLPFFPALVGALTSAWIDTGSLEATF